MVEDQPGSLPALEWLTIDGVVCLTGWRKQTIYQYHSSGVMPKAQHRAGRSPLWERKVIERWLRGEDPDYPRPGRGTRTDLMH